MARIQRSIVVHAPAHVAYQQLTQFEDYPLFIRDVALVRQIDDMHLHCCATVSGRNIEWDAEITKQVPDHCIAWHNLNGPTMSARVEVEPIRENASTIVLQLDCDPTQLSPVAGRDAIALVARHLRQDLLELKHLVEERAGDEASASGMNLQANASSLSDAFLSETDDVEARDGRFSIAEEVNLDQQSDDVRQVGKPPSDAATAPDRQGPLEAIAKTLRPADPDELA